MPDGRADRTRLQGYDFVGAAAYNRRMTTPRSRQVKLALAAAFGLGVLALAWLLLGATRSALALWHEIAQLPTWLAIAIGAALCAFAAAAGWLGWRLFAPRKRSFKPVEAPDRASLEKRVDALASIKAETAALEAELVELDQRRASGECYVAVFGEISAGKSSVIRALAPKAAPDVIGSDVVGPDVDVLGGTTTQVTHYRGSLGDRALVLADVPGTHEVGARERESIARDEALRAHAVVYVAAGDLTRQQDDELRWLHGYGKPLVLALNKIDQWNVAEREQLVAALRRRYGDAIAALVPVRAGGSERFERVLADGRRESVVREPAPDVTALRRTLASLVGGDAQMLETAREHAVLGGLNERVAAVEHAAREREATRVVERYTRRAVIGALAAVAPGTDLLIQGALATGLVRELANLYAVPVKELDLDAFLEKATLTVRTTSSVVLAIAGNALKAFPGLGTLGGGVLHAIAYGLIFDSLGRAVARTLAERQTLDQQHIAGALRELLGEKARARLAHIAAMAMDSTRKGGAD